MTGCDVQFVIMIMTVDDTFGVMESWLAALLPVNFLD